MELALKLAEKARGMTSPNPMVGCVIVKRNKIVGKGWHKKAGTNHAEINALEEAGNKAKDGILYVTLEPCSHWGRTPPCTQRIFESGVREVIIGMKDPNPLVNGYEEMKGRGLKVKIDILGDEAKKLNEYWIKWIKTKTPFVIVKAAMSLDGKIATRTGDSKYITGKEARKYVHQLRNDVDAVMIGVNTVIKDNPLLTPRLVKGKDPLKIVVDSKLRTPMNCNLMKDPKRLIIVTTRLASKSLIKKFQEKGVQIVIAKSSGDKVNLEELMNELGKQEITSIMIEGGAELNAAAIKAGIVDKILFFIAPDLIGEGLGAIGDLGIKKVDKRINLKNISSRKVGRDLLIEGYL